MKTLLIAFLLLGCCMAHADVEAPKKLNLLARSQLTLPDPVLSNEEWAWLRKKRVLRLGA
nr:hypothetical protein [Pantoea sp. 201603H]